MIALDVDDTTRCPVGPVCESCGGAVAPPCECATDLCGAKTGEYCAPGCPSLAADPDGPVAFGLAVITADTDLGVLCLTICDACTDHGQLPPLPLSCVLDGTDQHCEHVGRDLNGTAL